MIDLAGLCGAGYDMVRKVDKRGESARRGNELSERGENLSANLRNSLPRVVCKVLAKFDISAVASSAPTRRRPTDRGVVDVVSASARTALPNSFSRGGRNGAHVRPSSRDATCDSSSRFEQRRRVRTRVYLPRRASSKACRRDTFALLRALVRVLGKFQSCSG